MQQPDWATNEHQRRANCQEIVERSQDLLDGRLGVILAARALKELAFRVRAEEDEDFRLFRVIDSESDALPAGAERGKGSATALEREDARRPSLNSSITQLGRIGGYLNRGADGSAGNTVIWRGLSRLTDIEIGYLLGIMTSADGQSKGIA
jgi:hypothetical protein